MPDGITGKVLRIDLTEGTIKIESSTKYMKQFIASRGVAAKMLYDECGPEVTPFDPENLLIFSTGPIAGTSIPGAGRVFITCKSPLSVPEGMKCQSGFGGFWGPELKFAGYDHLILSGRSSEPVYITIDNDEVEIRDAGELWGKDAFESARRIKEDFDIDARICTIGQAGEKLVRFASILGGEQYSATGRGGSGAVMGSKNCKGIAVRGTGEVAVADPRKLLEITKKWHKLIKSSPGYPEVKERGEFRLIFAIDYFDVGNYESSDLSRFKNLKTNEFVEKYQTKMSGCMACPRPCFNYMRVPGVSPGALACQSYVGMSYGIWNNDLPTIWEAGVLCNSYGMDAQETSGTIGFMMELNRNGILTEQDTDGISFKRGSRKAILDAIHKIAKRESYGDIFAEGIPRAAEKIGGDAMKYAVHTKGLFPHSYNFRKYKGHSLLQAVGHKGGDPFPVPPPLRLEFTWDLPEPNRLAKKLGKERYGTENAIDPEAYGDTKVDVVIDTEHVKLSADILGCCARQVPQDVPLVLALEAFTAITGRKLSEKALIEADERVVHLERAFDVRVGIRRKDDVIPKKWLTEKVDTGPSKGAIIDQAKHEQMKDSYYHKRGWNVETGIPERAILEKMGLDDVADDLEHLNI